MQGSQPLQTVMTFSVCCICSTMSYILLIFGFQGLQMCDDLFVFAGGELYASIHKNKRAGRYAALGQRIEKHFHQVPAQLWATVTNKVTADEKGGRAGSDGTFDRCCGRRRYALS